MDGVPPKTKGRKRRPARWVEKKGKVLFTDRNVQQHEKKRGGFERHLAKKKKKKKERCLHAGKKRRRALKLWRKCGGGKEKKKKGGSAQTTKERGRSANDARERRKPKQSHLFHGPIGLDRGKTTCKKEGPAAEGGRLGGERGKGASLGNKKRERKKNSCCALPDWKRGGGTQTRQATQMKKEGRGCGRRNQRGNSPEKKKRQQRMVFGGKGGRKRKPCADRHIKKRPGVSEKGKGKKKEEPDACRGKEKRGERFAPLKKEKRSKEKGKKRAHLSRPR